MLLKEKAQYLQPYFANVFLYGCALLLFYHGNYYQQFLKNETKTFLLFLYLTYCIIALPYYIHKKQPSTNKSLLALTAAKKAAQHLFSKNREISFSQEQKVAILFIGVKFFFIPLMINFFFENFSVFKAYISKFNWYNLTLISLFTIDTLIFSIGYLIESKKLNNIVKSVEPTMFGWGVTLICYPPFNNFIGTFIPWGANDYAQFWNPSLTVLLRIIIISLLVIYVWASFALGFKASNLTNRGIVTTFPYNIVRHPAYISKNLIWWLTLFPAINFSFFLGMLFWSIIYYLRAITEERHLSQDEDYLKYKQKVKYKFIPRIF